MNLHIIHNKIKSLKTKCWPKCSISSLLTNHGLGQIPHGPVRRIYVFTVRLNAGIVEAVKILSLISTMDLSIDKSLDYFYRFLTGLFSLLMISFQFFINENCGTCPENLQNEPHEPTVAFLVCTIHDSVLNAFENCVILQGIRNTSLAPAGQLKP